MIYTAAETGTPGSDGDGGQSSLARLRAPSKAIAGPTGDLFIADTDNHRVRRVDYGRPPPPTLAGTTPDGQANDNNPAIRGAAAAGTTVRLYTDPACAGAVAGSGPAATFASPGITVTVPDDSTTSFYATATDSIGVGSGCSAGSATYQEDSVPPATPTIDSGPATVTNDASPTWTFTIDSDADAAGNQGTSASAAITLDTTPPGDAAITLAPTSPSQVRDPAWSFKVPTDASAECELTGPGLAGGWEACTSPASFTLASDGAHTFAVRAVDAAGNASAPTAAEFVLDTVAPVAPMLDAAPASPDNDRTVTWRFTAESDTTAECRLAGPGFIAAFASCSDRADHDLTAAADGTYTFTVRATDATPQGSRTRLMHRRLPDPSRADGFRRGASPVRVASRTHVQGDPVHVA